MTRVFDGLIVMAMGLFVIIAIHCCQVANNLSSSTEGRAEVADNHTLSAETKTAMMSGNGVDGKDKRLNTTPAGAGSVPKNTIEGHQRGSENQASPTQFISDDPKDMKEMESYDVQDTSAISPESFIGSFWAVGDVCPVEVLTKPPTPRPASMPEPEELPLILLALMVIEALRRSRGK